MSKRNTDTHPSEQHHLKACEHAEKAAYHHKEAAKHYNAGNHEKGAAHAYRAFGHTQHVHHFAKEAAKGHLEQCDEKEEGRQRIA